MKSIPSQHRVAVPQGAEPELGHGQQLLGPQLQQLADRRHVEPLQLVAHSHRETCRYQGRGQLLLEAGRCSARRRVKRLVYEPLRRGLVALDQRDRELAGEAVRDL